MASKREKAGSDDISGRINLRLDPPLRVLLEDLISLRMARDLSDYIRGLIIADAIELRKPIIGVEIPGWLSASHKALITQGEKSDSGRS